MKAVLILFLRILSELCIGQIIDISGVWEIKCPQGCSCEVQKFADLPLHQWFDRERYEKKSYTKDTEFAMYNFQPMAKEMLKVATCVIAEYPEELFAQLPSDIQVFTILESGNGETSISLKATTFQRFTDLISLDIQGIEPIDPSEKDIIRNHKQIGGVVLSADALIPLGMTLFYLNLERVQLTSLNPSKKSKANLVIKPMTSSSDEMISGSQTSVTNVSQNKGHRLIFLSQQNSGENEDKEILPYDLYKQEMEGYRENIGLFEGLGVLTHLRIYDCALMDISWHMFDGLNNLLYLSLEKNNLRFIPEFCFYGTPNLKLLSLASNQLLTLNSVDLAGLLTLEQLDLRGNNLTFLSELSFPPFPALRTADFRDNPLDSVFPSTFEIMNTTELLYLGGIGSQLKLQKNSLLGLRRLEILHMYNLEIDILERFILQGMPMLKQLKMRGNISSIDFDAFADLGTLADLDLSHCNIQRISMDAFYGLQKVKRIDLSYNNLVIIPPGLFSVQEQKELKEILLTKNKLTTLPGDFFKNLRVLNRQPQIQNIRLDGNPWDCTCTMAGWNPYLINRVKELAPRCFTPKRLQNWGVFYALRKGGLHCKSFRRKHLRKSLRAQSFGNTNSID